MAQRDEVVRPGGEVARPPVGLNSRLSPGPGRSASEVAAHQRARIHEAMIELVSEREYVAVTIRDLVQLANVSTRTFYDRFGGKDECLLATYELVMRSLTERAFTAQKGSRDWTEQVRLTFSALAQELADDPKAARLALVETFAVGPLALERMRRDGTMLEAMARAGFAGAPDRIQVPPLVVKGIVAGARRVACARLLSDREHELPVLSDELMHWALSFRSEATSRLQLLDRRPPQQSGIGSADRGKGVAGDANSQLLGDERTLILAATARLAASRGYGQLSARDIRAAAGVSRKSLDAHFDDVAHCFLASLELLIKRTLMRALRHGATADSWPAGLHRALVAFCTSVARDPAFARLGFIEVFGPGTPGIRFRARLIVAVADRLRRSAPPGQQPSELAAEASVGAVLGILHHHIAAGRAGQLPRLAPMLSFLMLAPAIGAPAAVDAIRNEQEQEQAGRSTGEMGVVGAL
jgi:AcrR family transcriptional regulator